MIASSVSAHPTLRVQPTTGQTEQVLAMKADDIDGWTPWTPIPTAPPNAVYAGPVGCVEEWYQHNNAWHPLIIDANPDSSLKDSDICKLAVFAPVLQAVAWTTEKDITQQIFLSLAADATMTTELAQCGFRVVDRNRHSQVVRRVYPVYRTFFL